MPKARSNAAEDHRSGLGRSGRRVHDYLSREATQETAEKQADAFNALFRRLLTFPYSGRSAEQYRLGLREAHTKRYRVFYTVRPDAVEIVRVLHGARDVGPEMF